MILYVNYIAMLAVAAADSCSMILGLHQWPQMAVFQIHETPNCKCKIPRPGRKHWNSDSDSEFRKTERKREKDSAADARIDHWSDLFFSSLHITSAFLIFRRSKVSKVHLVLRKKYEALVVPPLATTAFLVFLKVLSVFTGKICSIPKPWPYYRYLTNLHRMIRHV